jgi:hypothetical protein
LRYISSAFSAIRSPSRISTLCTQQGQRVMESLRGSSIHTYWQTSLEIRSQRTS